LSEQTRQAVDNYLKATSKRPGKFLFSWRTFCSNFGEAYVDGR